MGSVTEKHPQGMDLLREFVLEPVDPEVHVVPEGSLLLYSFSHHSEQNVARFLRAFTVPEDVTPQTFLTLWGEAYNRPDQMTVLELRRDVASSYLLTLTRIRESVEKALSSLPTLKQ